MVCNDAVDTRSTDAFPLLCPLVLWLHTQVFSYVSQTVPSSEQEAHSRACLGLSRPAEEQKQGEGARGGLGRGACSSSGPDS